MLLGLENITHVFPRTLILIFPRIIYFMLIEKQKLLLTISNMYDFIVYEDENDIEKNEYD